MKIRLLFLFVYSLKATTQGFHILASPSASAPLTSRTTLPHHNQRLSKTQTTLQSTPLNNDGDTSKVGLNNDPREMKLDWKIIRQQAALFRQMALPYYKESKTGKLLLAGLLGLTLLNSGVSVVFSYLSKDFWNALSAKDSAEFYFVLQKYLGALIVGAPVITYYKYQREQLAVHWREWMTARTFTLYTTRRVYYNLERGSTIDNPDQRIAEDVNTFTGYSLQLVITILTSLIDLVSFSAILWSIYPQLFGAIILYASIGTFVTTFMGQSLVGLNFFQLQREADLRYVLVRLRDNSESIAFYAGEDLEGQAVESRMENVMDNRREINKVQRNLEFFTNGYRYLIQILPVAVVAPKYFAGEIALGIISQSVGAFNHILSDLSIIINQFERLSSFSAGIERLSTFYEAIREADLARNETTPLLDVIEPLVESVSTTNETTAEPETVSLGVSAKNDTILLRQFPVNGELQSPEPNVVLSVKDLDLYTPDKKRLLVKNLSLQLREGQHLLIVGDSGRGKSSFLRGVAGLWTVGHGSIDRPDDDHVYFLPQRPYCTLGSLKDQLLYPSLDYNMEKDESAGNKGDVDKQKKKNDDSNQKILPRAHWLKTVLTDDDLLEILEKVDLLDVACRAGDGDPKAGLQAVLDWTNVLSLGEQQRLAFGRLLVNQPRLVILDEATSALDLRGEAKMYSLLQNMARREFNGSNGLSPPGTTYISVGHRPSLLAYHDKRLCLAGPDGGHEFSDIEKSSLQIPASVKNL